MSLAEGQMLGQYKIVEQLGQGGMATIYRAYHARLDRYVAIKVMHQAFLEDPGFLTRFEREAQIVARLEHPNIVPIYDFSDVDGQPYLVMKLIEGRTLKAANAQRSLPLSEIARILPPIASALDYAHSRGVLHRDIKPSNIIIGDDGTAYLTDFGLARLSSLGESTLSSDVLLGTPQYISPEQAMGRPDIDARTDQYSLGVVLYELVTGRVPFSADTPYAVIHDHIYTPLPAPNLVNPEVTPAVADVLSRALAKDPADRYASATEMVQAFLKAARDSGMKLNGGRKRAVEASGIIAPDADETSRSEANAYDPFSEQLLDEIEADGATVVLDTPPPGAKPDSQVSPPIHAKAGSPSRNVEVHIENNKLQANLNWNGKQRSWTIDAEGVRPSVALPAAAADPVPPPAPGFRWEDVEKWDGWKGDKDAWKDAGSQVRDAIEGFVDENFKDGADSPYIDDERAARQRAEKQIAKRKEFYGHLISYVIVNIILVLIYAGLNAFLGAGPWSMPWPLIVALGWGSGLAAHAIEVYEETGARAAKRNRAVLDAYYNAYGPNWRQKDRKALRKVRKVVEEPYTKRRELAQNAVVYAMIIPMLWVIYFSVNNFLGGGPWNFPWPAIVMLGWGISFPFQIMELMGTSRKDSAIEREMARERQLMGTAEKSKRKNDQMSLDELTDEDDSVHLTEDGEFTDSMVQSINRDQPTGRKR